MSKATLPRRTTTALIVLDGWGVGENVPHNAIRAARTPHWDRLWASPSKTVLSASGESVGLPGGQMGNSEVGHMNLGAGRVVYQDLTRIDRAIESGEFDANPVLNDVVDTSLRGLDDAPRVAGAQGRVLHVFGLLSPGGVHSHERHIAALLALAKRKGATVRLHAFLDGRDTPPRGALASLQRIEAQYPGVIASMTGRYFAMDRDARWPRTERAYALLRDGQAAFHADTPQAALQAAYERGEGDEFVQPTAIRAADRPPATVNDGDSVMFMNFRADRARQLTQAFVSRHFTGFKRPARAKLAVFATLTRYADDLVLPAAFAPQRPVETFGECLAARGRTQLRLAETEKYAHVTYFFSGGRERPFVGEERILVPSPPVATYDLAPAMSAAEVTDHFVAAIEGGRFDAVVCNYANGDMVGHTGDFAAAVRAVETIDGCLGRVCAALRRSGGQCLITADHGNVECMADAVANQPHTAHTSGPVPLIYVGPQRVRLKGAGQLADVAPTLLALMGIAPPPAMTGRSLLATVDDVAHGCCGAEP